MRLFDFRKSGLFIAFLLLVALPLMAQPGRGQFKPDELIVKLDAQYSIDSINAWFGTTVKSHQAQTGAYLLAIPEGEDPESLAVAITNTEGVVYCGPNFYLSSPEGLQRSSPFVEVQARIDPITQKAAETLNLAAAQLLSTGLDVSVAIIDGGVNFSHPSFAVSQGRMVSAWDYVDNDSIADDEPGGANSGHGTFIAGVTRLVAPDANIYSYRVLDTTGVGDGYSIASAVLRAIDDSCKVINLSLGMIGIHDALDDALKLARQHEITIVAAAGNDSTDATSLFPFPATRSYCLTVAALDSMNLKADFSNYGTKIDVCAPGTQILAPFLDSSYAWWDGTSFAVPFVGGLAALMYANRPDETADQIDTAMQLTATSVDSLNPGFEGLLGTGLINPVAALGFPALVMSGDINGDGAVDMSDLTHLLDFLFAIEGTLFPGMSADVNCDSSIDIGDLSLLIDYLFNSGITPCLML
jgi:subtilisin family serine protease